jgi:hypothetical protein
MTVAVNAPDSQLQPQPMLSPHALQKCYVEPVINKDVRLLDQQ